MSTVEVSEQELRTLKAAYALQEKMMAKDKRKFERMAKEAIPQLEITDDLAEPYVEPIRKELNELREWKKGLEDRQEQWEKHEGLSTLRRKHGLTDDGVKAIEKLMKEEGIKKPEYAMAVWEKLNPPAPTIRGVSPNNFGVENLVSQKDDMKSMFANPDRWENTKINQILTEMRSGNDE
jgi:hypothetical protein